MNYYRINNEQVYIYFDFDWDIVNAVKKLPKRKWKKDMNGKPWSAPMVRENIKPLLELAKKYHFEMTDEVVKELTNVEKQHNENLKNSHAMVSDIEVAGLGGELMPFQKVGVEYIKQNKRVMVGDQTGLGKTIEALASIQALNAYPALIVCPASLKLNWEKEANKWLDKKVVVLEGTTPYEFTGDVVIINYAIIKDWVNELKGKFEIAIADESHKLKNKDSQRSKAGKEIFSTIKYRLLLTATPIENRPKELVHQLEVLGQIDKFGGAWNFLQQYCDAKEGYWGWDFDGASNTKELHEKMRATCYIRRLKQQVMTELPPIQRSMMPVEIDNRSEYNETARTVREYLRERAEERAMEDGEFIQSIAGLSDNEQERRKQARQSRIYNQSLYAEALVEIERLKQASAKGKLKAVKKWVSDFLESGEKIILFAVHKDVVRELADEFDAPTIVGGQSRQSVEDAKEQFQNDTDTKVIVANITAGGLGHTLTAATHVAFVEMDWTPTAHSQAEARAYGRVNDPHGVNSWYFVGKDTVDEDVYKLLEKKRKVVDAVTDGKEVEEINIAGEIMDILKHDKGENHECR